MKPGLNIMGGVHPFGFRGPIPCMLDIAFADDMGGMPDLEGTFDVDDDSDAILDIDSTGVLRFVAVGTLLSGWKPVIGSFIDILGINGFGLADLRIIVPVKEPLIG